MIRRARRRPLLATAAATMVLGACASGGYRLENESIVDLLPMPDGATSVEVEHYDFCSRDSCLTGNDRSGALLTYRIDAADSLEAQRAQVDEYRAALDEWEATVDEGCANADTSTFCDDIVWASFRRGEAVIDLNLDNWPTGFEVHVDAHAAADD